MTYIVCTEVPLDVGKHHLHKTSLSQNTVKLHLTSQLEEDTVLCTVYMYVQCRYITRV